MDIDLEEHQADLAGIARRFFESRSPVSSVRDWEASQAGYAPQVWQEMADLGWLRLGHPESVGGVGGGTLDLSVIYQAMGRSLTPVPHLESAVVGAGVLAAAGTPLARDLLEPVLAGTTVVTPALAEDDAGFGPESVTLPGTFGPDGALRLDGSKILVGYANSARYLIVAARTPLDHARASGITLALVDTAAPGVTLPRLPNIAGYPLYATTFDAVRVAPEAVLGTPGAGWELLGPILDRAAVLRAAQIQGAAERLLELSVEYASRRTQFGQPIGRYQAVQYLCSDIAINAHLTSLFVRYAAGRLDGGCPPARPSPRPRPTPAGPPGSPRSGRTRSSRASPSSPISMCSCSPGGVGTGSSTSATSATTGSASPPRSPPDFDVYPNDCRPAIDERQRFDNSIKTDLLRIQPVAARGGVVESQLSMARGEWREGARDFLDSGVRPDAGLPDAGLPDTGLPDTGLPAPVAA